MSRTLALIATLAICELSICSSASMSENSTSRPDVPANSESIAETAEAEQPAKLIESKTAGAGRQIEAKLQAATPKYDLPTRAAGATAIGSLAAPAVSAGAKDGDADADETDLLDEKEISANTFMSRDDSGAKIDPLLYYQAGLRFMKEKKYQLSLEAFNKALEINPRYYEASYRKALVFQLTGYDKYAARRYQDVLKYRPDMDEARINLAELHRKHKHLSGAEEQLEAVIQHNWASFEAHYNLANVLVEDNKMEDALKQYKFCLKMKPNNANLHNNLGVLFLQKNYPDEALQEFRKAAQLAPKNQMFQTNMTTAARLVAARKSKDSSM
jgi:Tfp pilus assembly protein PilF